MHLLPGVCGPDGFPRSWQHYVYGLQYLGRWHVRDQVKQAEAFRIARNADDDGWGDWTRMAKRIGG